MRRITYRLSALKKKIRAQEARFKFLLGLSFEKAGLAFTHKRYLKSQQAFKICQMLAQTIAQNKGEEHQFYRMGEAAFASHTFMANETGVDNAKTQFGENWKKVRYHHLVRLGGDILRSGLADYPKATMLGALLSYANQNKPTTALSLSSISLA